MSFNSSLALWLHKRSSPLSFQEIISIVNKAAEALQQLHNQQKVHQDINPFNVLIAVDGENSERINLKLADRGTIVDISSRSGKNFHVNSQLMYIAPEQWNGYAVPATDQYALAVMTYELLTGRSIFQGTPAQLLDLQIKVQPAAPSTLNQRVSPAIDSVVLTALAKSPRDRFPSVSAFAHALEQAMLRPASLSASIPEMFAHDILRATLLISKTEAKKGTLRTIALPSGQRITISVPKGAYDGQIIRLEGYSTGTGVLLLTIAISKNETGISVRGLTKQNHSRQKAVILVSLILVILLGSIGLFSRLSIRSVSIPYPPLIGSLAIDDTLHDNTRGYNWPDGTDSNSSTCKFVQGAYHVVITQAGAFHYCIAGNTEFSNFAYEVRMTIVKGDEGGIIFRADGLNSKFYYFRIGQDGSYDLYLYVDKLGAHAKRLTGGITPTIHTGLNHPNLLAVVARNNILDLYVNNQNITHVSNNAYSSGQIGVTASFDTDLTEVAFSNLKVWEL